MPDRKRYDRYRATQTTIWISKKAQAFITRERDGGDSTADVVDRLVREVKAARARSPKKKK
jgi:hypothetical protein